MKAALTLEPIGVIHTPWKDRVSAPRQAIAAREVLGTLELSPGKNFEDALSDVDAWEYVWVLYWFHLNAGWRPKVMPPRSRERHGVFATRSPHRPNPIGLSVVRLESVSGLTLHVRGVDMIDGSPLLDIKPYVAYADAFPEAGTGWLGPRAEGRGAPCDPEPGYEVVWATLAEAQARWLADAHGIDLVAPVTRTLTLGPEPHAYRRIRAEGDGMRLAVKDWRVRFHVAGRVVTVDRIVTGYRPAQIAEATDGPLAVHRAFVARFGGA